MRGVNIPTMFHRKSNGDRSHEKHVTVAEMSSTSITSNAEVAFPNPNKSDYIYLTQSTDSDCDCSISLITRFPLDDFDANRAFVSHITELMRTTNSVTMKCDFNAYLNNVSISRNLPLAECTTLSRDPQNATNERKTDDVSSSCSKHSSYTKFDDLLALIANEKALLKRVALESQGSLRPPRMRLCGGGEDSINNGTNAWGTPPTSANSTSAWGMANQQPPQAWGGTPGNSNANNNSSNNNNQPATSQSQRQPSQSQDQNANKAPQQVQNSAGSSSTPNAWNRNPTQPTGHNPSVANNNLQLQQQQQQQQQQPQQQQQIALANNGNIAAKSQLEQLSNMREALFSQDGWSCQNVNQDTNWEVPGSPEPGKADNNAPPGGAGGGNGPNASATGWKPCNTNNGTELWEANLRNGGAPQAPQQPVQKAPWGPASNIGGTWGEDDDSSEANVWNGGASANPQTAAPPSWGQNNPAMWPPGNASGPNPAAVKKENDWGGTGVIGGNAGANPTVPPAVSGWDGRGGAAPSVNIPGPIGQNTPMDTTRDIRGDPRGISGRLNGNVAMWDQPNVPNLPAAAKIAQGPLPTVAGGSGNQWNAPIPNKMPGAWDDATSSLNTRPTLDDGPGALWNQGPLSRQNSNASNWKDMSDNVSRNSVSRNPAGNMLMGGGPVARGMRLGGINPGMKPDSTMWGQSPGLPLNGSWDDGGWEDKAALGGSGPWNDFGQNNLWNKGKQQGSGWPDPSDMIGGGGDRKSVV